jgi:hypothetical protein
MTSVSTRSPISPDSTAAASSTRIMKSLNWSATRRHSGRGRGLGQAVRAVLLQALADLGRRQPVRPAHPEVQRHLPRRRAGAGQAAAGSVSSAETGSSSGQRTMVTGHAL